MSRSAILLVCVVASSCAGEAGDSPDAGDTSGGDDQDDDDDDPIPDVATGDESGSGEIGCACDGVGDGIYIWFEEGDVGLYDPERNEVTDLGTLGCDMPAYFPNAIAVSPDGAITANLANGSGGGYPFMSSVAALDGCEPAPSDAVGFPLVGMTYMPTAQGCETVFMFDNSARPGVPAQLVRWDVADDERVEIATSEYLVAELAGTPDGRLFAYLVNAEWRPSIAELDPQTGELLSEIGTPVEIGNALVFAFWRDNLYMINNYDVDPFLETTETRVVRVDPDTNATGLIMPPFADRIVLGANAPPCLR